MNEREWQEAIQQPSKKNYYEGTHRIVSPETTLDRLAHIIPKVGITRIADVTGLDRLGVPVCMVVRPNSKSLSVSQGKGLSVAAAKVSGIMEAIELFSAENFSSGCIWSSYNGLVRSQEVVDPNTLPLKKYSKYNPDQDLRWVASFDIFNHKEVLIPFDVVTMNFLASESTKLTSFISSSNGLAAGNTLLEAVLHALYEVIERDQLTIWILENQNSNSQRRIVLGTILDLGIRSVIGKCRAAGTQVALWYISHDIDIPCFAATLLPNESSCHSIPVASGFGCHVDKRIAAIRALTEAAQSRLTKISGGRDDLVVRDFDAENRRLARQLVEASIAEQREIVDFEVIPSLATEELQLDYGMVCQTLLAAGFDRCLVLNLTEPTLNIAVVKVVVPCLEYKCKDEQYVPGRRALAILRRNASV